MDIPGWRRNPRARTTHDARAPTVAGFHLEIESGFRMPRHDDAYPRGPRDDAGNRYRGIPARARGARSPMRLRDRARRGALARRSTGDGRGRGLSTLLLP